MALKVDKKKLLDKIIDETEESRRNRAGWEKLQTEWLKRFEALRSVQCLDQDVKLWPWKGASNVGIPLEATVVYALLARYLKTTFGIEPMVNVKGRGESDWPFGPSMEGFVNWELIDEMKIFMDFYFTYQGLLNQGDVIGKTIWERKEVEWEEDTYILVDENDQPYINPQDRQPLEVEKNHPPITDQMTGAVYSPQPATVPHKEMLYNGPRLFIPPLKQIVVPSEADTPDVTEIDWIYHEFWQPWSWIKRRGNAEIFDKEETDKLKKNRDEKRERPEESLPSVRGIEAKKWTNRFPIGEWHGTFEDESGKDQEIIAMVEPKEKILLGYIPNRFYYRTGQRQFVHWQFSPKNDAFYARGVPEWLRGIRSMIDAMINQGIDRGSLYNNPPILYDKFQSGFFPYEHKFGPGKSWGLKNINLVSPMNLPPERQAQFIYQEFLMGLIQRLFGVSDYQTGSSLPQGMASAREGTKTATGISIMVSEANTMFDMRIKLVQEWSNPNLVRQIVAHNALNVTDEKVFAVTEGPNPFKRISRKALRGNYDYIFRGNSITTNKMVDREDVMLLYKLFVDSQNPFIIDDPETFRQLTQDIINAFDRKNLKIKSVDELRKLGIKSKLEQRKMAQEAVMAEKLGLPIDNLTGEGNGGRIPQEEPVIR